MSDVRALRQFLRVLNPMMNVVSYAFSHASFTPFGLPPVGAKHIQNVLPNLQLDQTKIFPVCGKKPIKEDNTKFDRIKDVDENPGTSTLF